MMHTRVKSRGHQEKSATENKLHHNSSYRPRSSLTVMITYKTSYEFDQVHKVTMGCLVVSNIMPLDEGPRSLPVLFFSVNPVWPDRPYPVYFFSYRAQLGKRNVRLVPDMLYEGLLPTFPVARTLDFKDENRFIKVWIVVIDDFDDLHDQVRVSPGAEVIFFDMAIMR